MIEEAGVVIAFWVLAVTTIVNAIMVAAVRNLLHAVLFLVLTFVGLAGLFITLSADFVAAVQLLVYAGAVAVLMVFAIMLTPRAARDNADNEFSLPALVLSGLMAAVATFVALDAGWRTQTPAGVAGTAASIGDALLDPFVLPFEVASVVLVAAMVGAIVLVREDS